LKRFKEKLKVSESKCGDLTSKLNKKTAEIMKLEQQQDAEAEYSVQVQVLEGQLDQALKMNSDLVTKLEKCKQELVETKDSLNNQDSYCKELKTKLNELAEKIQVNKLITTV
jgi:archaellum component FlaC